MKKADYLSLCFISIFMVPMLHASAQSSEFKRQRAEFALFNVGFNGIVGGVGSLVNKDEEKTNFQNFINGFYKGAIGGGISHIGLSLSHQIDQQQNIAIAWPARLTNALGASIVQNAAENKRTFERLHFNLYLARLEYYPYRKAFNARLFTSSLYGLINVGKGAKFDLGKSLESGVFYFRSDNGFSITGAGEGRATGQVSSVGMRNRLTGDQFYDTFAEEIAHIMQYDRKVGINPLFMKADQRWKNNSSTYNFLSRYVYLDLNGPVFFLAYLAEQQTDSNFFEVEAVNYANKRVDDGKR